MHLHTAKFSRRKIIFFNCSLFLRFCDTVIWKILESLQSKNMRVFAHQDAQPKKTFDKSRHVHCTLCNIIEECLLLKAGKTEREASYSSLSTTSFSFPDFPAAAREPDPLLHFPSPPCYLCLLLSIIYCSLYTATWVKCNCHNCTLGDGFVANTFLVGSCRVW